MQTINVEELKKIQKEEKNVKIINVLPRQAFEKEHIPNTMNLPVDDENFVKNVENIVPDKNQKVVVYCSSKQCPSSGKAAEKLEQAGFKNVLDFERGTEGWKKTGETVETK